MNWSFSLKCIRNFYVKLEDISIFGMYLFLKYICISYYLSIFMLFVFVEFVQIDIKY